MTDEKKQKQRAYNRRRYYERKAKGLCQWCDRPAEPGRIRCVVHRKISADYVVGVQSIRRVNGLCVRCGKEKVERYSTCMVCRQKLSANYRRKKAAATAAG
jgi:hypothetical protein